ncbi:MAG: hypothetical protein RLY31_692, partial [Bacteroidota bacterium]
MSGPLTLTAQKIEEFSENRNTFLKELGDHITASRNSRTIDNFKKFDRYAGTGLFREEDLARIRKTCNIMLHQRVPVSPYYSEYLNVLCLLKTSQVEQIVFDTWNNIVDSLLDDVQNRRFSGVQEFLAFSAGFFEKQAIRYSDLGTSWLCKGAEFQLEYVNKAPVVRFRELDLTAKRGSDSIVIQRTGGTYYPLEHLWRGQGGIVTWERLDLNSDVFVELGSYQLETKKSLYTVENARLHYPLYFGEEMVEGIFSDKLVSQNPATEGSYPRFQSAENLLEISNFGEGIQFIGGFRMEGTTVYGFGTADQKATLLLRNKKEIVSYYGQAELFTIKQEERIIGESVESILYFGQDSIYHPSVNVRFEIPTRELQLSRGKRGNDRNPFFLSLSKVNVDVERIDFMLDQDSIYIGRRNFGFAKSSTSATFESLKYFQESEYFRLQNISTTNPIALLKLISQEVDDRV